MSQTLTRPPLYKGFRFPPEIISQGVWLYYRFGVSLRDVSELLLARGIEVFYEAIRLWTVRFGRSTRDACDGCGVHAQTFGISIEQSDRSCEGAG